MTKQQTNSVKIPFEIHRLIRGFAGLYGLEVSQLYEEIILQSPKFKEIKSKIKLPKNET